MIEELYTYSVNEQAVERRGLIAKLDNLGQQILQNLCLIAYAKKYGNAQHKQLIRHWSSELESYCSQIGAIKLKKSTKEAKLKAIKGLWFDDYEYNSDSNVVYTLVGYKFQDEQIYDYPYIMLIIEHVMKVLPRFVDILADYSMQKFRSFINSEL